jgi:hypothetical protein
MPATCEGAQVPLQTLVVLETSLMSHVSVPTQTPGRNIHVLVRMGTVNIQSLEFAPLEGFVAQSINKTPVTMYLVFVSSSSIRRTRTCVCGSARGARYPGGLGLRHCSRITTYEHLRPLWDPGRETKERKRLPEPAGQWRDLGHRIDGRGRVISSAAFGGHQSLPSCMSCHRQFRSKANVQGWFRVRSNNPQAMR